MPNSVVIDIERYGSTYRYFISTQDERDGKKLFLASDMSLTRVENNKACTSELPNAMRYARLILDGEIREGVSYAYGKK